MKKAIIQAFLALMIFVSALIVMDSCKVVGYRTHRIDTTIHVGYDTVVARGDTIFIVRHDYERKKEREPISWAIIILAVTAASLLILESFR